VRGRNPGDNPETEGRVVAVHGRHYRVESALGRHDCVTRGKKGGLACGDRIRFRPTGADTGVIEASLPRANLLYRSDAFRAKLLAANLDQVFVVTAARPTPNLALLDRCLVAAEAAGIAAHIVLNKADLVEASTTLATQLQAYAGLGYDLLSLSAKADVTPLAERLAGRTSILVGASGVGKSTLVNALVPEAEIVTQAISEVLDSGKHTTTHTRLYHLPNGGALIDSPGMQEFGLRHLSTTDLQRAFPEFRGLESGCRFYNCQHLREPGCAVLAALEHGDILPARWQTYRMLIEENAPTPY
jgi:ribosome biogenesis GTPase